MSFDRNDNLVRFVIQGWGIRIVVNTNDYQMAIDMLRCHLGLSEDEAKQHLGLSTENNEYKCVIETHKELSNLESER